MISHVTSSATTERILVCRKSFTWVQTASRALVTSAEGAASQGLSALCDSDLSLSRPSLSRFRPLASEFTSRRNWSPFPVIRLPIMGCDRVVGIVTALTVRGSNPGGGEIFRTRPDRPCGPPSVLCNGYQVFSDGKATGVWRWPSTPSIAEVKRIVELYLYSPSGSSWPVVGWTLPLLLPLLLPITCTDSVCIEVITLCSAMSVNEHVTTKCMSIKIYMLWDSVLSVVTLVCSGRSISPSYHCSNLVGEGAVDNGVHVRGLWMHCIGNGRRGVWKNTGHWTVLNCEHNFIEVALMGVSEFVLENSMSMYVCTYVRMYVCMYFFIIISIEHAPLPLQYYMLSHMYSITTFTRLPKHHSFSHSIVQYPFR